MMMMMINAKTIL